MKLFAPGVDRKAAIARLKAQPVCTREFQYLIFALLFLGFAVKVPIVPLHSWLPDAHVEAPTPISMILAGVLLKLGGYGLIRVAFPICPWAAAELAWWVGLIGVIGIVYGALVAMGQTDFKKLLAYSSVSHMGFVVLGLAAWGSAANARYWQWGLNGAMFQMVAHGITASALFFVVGVVYDRAHHRDLNRFGGLNEPMPLYAGFSAILFFASMGLPGLCGFVGEFCVVLGGVELLSGPRDPGDLERHSDRGLPAVDLAARLSGHQSSDQELPRPDAAGSRVSPPLRDPGDRSGRAAGGSSVQLDGPERQRLDREHGPAQAVTRIARPALAGFHAGRIVALTHY